MREREIITRSPGGFSAQKAQKTSQVPKPAHERKETHMVGLLDLLNQEKAERAAERRAQFVLQQHLGGKGTVPLSLAGDSTLVMMKKAMNMSKLGCKEGGGEAGQQAGQTMPRQEAPQFHENRHVY
jgi:hypothetical protein